MNDYVGSKPATEGLALKVRDWWAKRGFTMRVVVESERFGGGKIFVLRMPDYEPDVNATRSVE